MDILEKVKEKLANIIQEPYDSHNDYTYTDSSYRQKFAYKMLIYIEQLEILENSEQNCQGRNKYYKNRSDNMRCKECDTSLEYNQEYDSHYCPVCNIWAEETCDDKHCKFCKDRPEKPMDKDTEK